MTADPDSSCTASCTDSWSQDGARNPWSAPTTELCAPPWRTRSPNAGSAPFDASSSTAPSSGTAANSRGSSTTTSITTTRTGPTVHSTSDHPAPPTLQTSQTDTSKSLERPAVVDSSTSTEMPPDQPRHSFRHPHPSTRSNDPLRRPHQRIQTCRLTSHDTILGTHTPAGRGPSRRRPLALPVEVRKWSKDMRSAGPICGLRDGRRVRRYAGRRRKRNRRTPCREASASAGHQIY